MTEKVRAAGGVVARRRRADAEVEVVIVHRPAYDDWTLPKGKLDPGEDEPAAARREVLEECGLDCLLGPQLGVTEYRDSSGRDKTVRYWLMAAAAGEAAAANEVDDVRWATLAESRALLSYERDRRLLEGLVLPREGTLALVRHAKAGNRAKWDRPDELRPLTQAGRRQAEALVLLLAARRPALLVSSAYVRCIETLEPLAAATGLPLQRHDALAEGASVDAALALLRAVGTLGDAVVCTHGDVEEVVLQSIAAAGTPLADRVRLEKGSVWLLEVRAGEIVGGRYLPPPA
jgi:8-oxo-(d)GTP phosphatase